MVGTIVVIVITVVVITTVLCMYRRGEQLHKMLVFLVYLVLYKATGTVANACLPPA